MTSTFGIIDIGSNSIRLSIYKVKGRNFSLLINEKKIIGLAGHSVNGHLLREGVERASEAVKKFRRICGNFRVVSVFAFATASLRNVSNSAEAARAISDSAGIPVEIISGESEAVYAFEGARNQVPLGDGLLIDIGGGSTELLCYKNGAPAEKSSIPMGSLNAFTGFVSGIVPVQTELVRMREAFSAYLDGVPWLKGFKTDEICGVGGTMRASGKLHKLLTGMETDTKYYHYPARAFPLVYDRVAAQHDTGLLLQNMPERIHTIIPGLTLASVIIERTEPKTIKLSQYGVREGYLLSGLTAAGI